MLLKPKTMSDNNNTTRPEDSTKVNISENYEARYWTSRFNCTRKQLEEAIAHVGVSAERIEQFLKKNNQQARA
jgi:hypothetical protein